MSTARDPSTRERIINAANLLFASGVPVFASSTSRFDLVASTTPDGSGIHVKLQQWHRVGDSSLRCVVAIVGPTKNSYRDALHALAEDLERMVEQSRTTHHQQTFTPIR
ncbi:hypothetical protein UCDDS831_g02800 [Diplodia seriata]|uniref:Uncharacterized protein n=1 Tax=Diplodia seriata TaxID=420778 RepID=A0A0G2EN60_9PEZI|nr:hypothetical protein UCDDS831_g02800 [Diplodia seriata]